MDELYIKYEYWIAALQLIFAMLGMGATLTIDDFKGVVRMPKAISFGLLIQLCIVPLAALLFIKCISLTTGLIIGLALIAAIPGGATSNIFTYVARGNIPLSISITSITSLACLVTTPLILSLLITDFLPSDFTMPTGQIIRDITFTLLLPLVIGILILKFASKHADWISRWSIRLSLVGIAMIVIGSAVAGRINIQEFGFYNLFIVTCFITTLSIISKLSAGALKLPKPDRTAIEMEAVVRNVNLAILIKVSIFPAATYTKNTLGDTVLFTVLAYGALQLLLAAVLIMVNRSKNNALS